MTPPDAFIQRDLNIEVAPRFADWKIINSDALVVGTVEQITRDGNVLIRGSVRMWDVYGEELMRFEDSRGRQVSGRRFTTTPEDIRRIAHKIADAIYSRLTVFRHAHCLHFRDRSQNQPAQASGYYGR